MRPWAEAVVGCGRVRRGEDLGNTGRKTDSVYCERREGRVDQLRGW